MVLIVKYPTREMGHLPNLTDEKLEGGRNNG
jgi:hypothetical protein